MAKLSGLGINKPKFCNQTIYENSKKHLEGNSKVPILKGCANKKCFCTGACNEIIGYRDKLPNEF